MSKMFLHPELSLAEREKLLRNLCIKEENRSYARTLDQSEIDLETKRYAQDGMDLKAVKEQAKNIADEYKAKKDNIEKRMDERLDKINNGKQQVSGRLYGIPNYVEGKMLFYDQYGELVDSRDMTPDEKQGRLQLAAPVKGEDTTAAMNAEAKATHGVSQDGKTYILNSQADKSEMTEDIPHEEVKDNDGAIPEHLRGVVEAIQDDHRRKNGELQGNGKSTASGILDHAADWQAEQAKMDSEMPLTEEMREAAQAENAAKNKGKGRGKK